MGYSEIAALENEYNYQRRPLSEVKIFKLRTRRMTRIKEVFQTEGKKQKP